HCCLIIVRRLPHAMLFPYTTLFRSTIVATVRNTQGPARFLATGFMVRKDGNIQQFETNSDWRVSDQQGAQKQHAVEAGSNGSARSEEHTSELQSRFDLVCRLLLEKQ